MKIVKLTQNVQDIDTTYYDSFKKCVIFDIDDTLYKENTELVKKRRMAGYNHLKKDLSITFEEFYNLSSKFTKEYGTNYKGFIKNYFIDDDLIEELDNVYGEITSHFTDASASIELLKNLSSLQGTERVGVFCFSNSNSKQSEYTLDTLNLSQYVDTLFCTGYKPNQQILCKPMKEAFDFVNSVINISGNKKILFFDDNSQNVIGANQAGWKGIKVNNADDIKNVVEKEIKDYF